MSRPLRIVHAGIAAGVLAVLACSDPTSSNRTPDQPRLPSSLRSTQAITACGTIITAPGDYALTRDLNDCPGHGIQIFASSVTLQLRGHILSGGPTSVYGINVGAASDFHGGVSRVVLKGPGVIEHFNTGINMEQVTYSKIKNITSRLNLHGLALNSSHANGDLLPSLYDSIIGSRFMNNRAHGVTMNGAGQSVFVGNTSRENGRQFNGNGFFLYDADAITLDHNQSQRNQGYGVRVEYLSTDNRIVNNVVTGNDGGDLSDGNPACDNNTWAGNSFGHATPACIH